MYRIYDSGPETLDRYTLEFKGYCWGFSDNPSHPLGFGQFVGEVGNGVDAAFLESEEEIYLSDLSEAAQSYVLWIVEGEE